VHSHEIRSNVPTARQKVTKSSQLNQQRGSEGGCEGVCEACELNLMSWHSPKPEESTCRVTGTFCLAAQSLTMSLFVSYTVTMYDFVRLLATPTDLVTQLLVGFF